MEWLSGKLYHPEAQWLLVGEDRRTCFGSR
jgi:hypothetical protein